MATEVVTVDPTAPAADALAHAVDVLRRGGIVAFPTETFYGLGAAALDPAAVVRVFEVKGRPESKPLSVLIDAPAMVAAVADAVSPGARALMERHWPGPLTLVLRAGAAVPEALTAGTGTVGVRVSPHAVARELPRLLAAPVTAPSANPSGDPPATTAAAVLAYFDGAIDLVLDGGPTAGGPASTVLDVTVDPPRVLRAGAVRP